MRILFVCRGNTARSQMAEAFFNKMSSQHASSSAGIYRDIKNGKTVGDNEKARFVWDVMDEEGIDIRDAVRDQLTSEMLKSFDKIIVMADKGYWPDYLLNNPKVVSWEVLDPKGKDLEFHRKARDLIREKVNELLSEIEK